MISTIVLVPASFPQGDAGRALLVRSLAWLVGAAVAGVVGELVLAAPAGLALLAVADAVGGRLVEAEDEGRRLAAAARVVRSDPVLVLVAGWAGEPALVEELARRSGAPARLLAQPLTLMERLAPSLAPVVGVLGPAAAVGSARSFAALARTSRPAPALATRARRLA